MSLPWTLAANDFALERLRRCFLRHVAVFNVSRDGEPLATQKFRRNVSVRPGPPWWQRRVPAAQGESAAQSTSFSVQIRDAMTEQAT